MAISRAEIKEILKTKTVPVGLQAEFMTRISNGQEIELADELGISVEDLMEISENVQAANKPSAAQTLGGDVESSLTQTEDRAGISSLLGDAGINDAEIVIKIKKKEKADEEAAREKNTSAFAKKDANKRAREKSAAQALAE